MQHSDIAATAGQTRAAPRIYYLDPLASGPLDRFSASFEHAAGLGFDHVMLPPVFAPGRGGDFFLPSDFATLNPAISGAAQAAALPALKHLSGQARSHGLTVLLDLVPDRLAADSPAITPDDSLFAHTPAAAALDPRYGGTRLAEAIAAADDDAAAERLARWWAPTIEAWQAAGIGGLRVLGLDRMRAAGALLRQLRAAAPDLTLIGWTPGMDWDRLPALVGCGVDYVCSSLGWWDWRSDWVWEEWALLRRIAPVLACPEAPYEARLAQASSPPAIRQAAACRMLKLAGWVGDGWLMPAGVEAGATEPMSLRGPAPAASMLDLSVLVREINGGFAAKGEINGGFAAKGEINGGFAAKGGMNGGAAHAAQSPVLLASGGGPVLALLCRERTLILANTSLTQHHAIEASLLLPRVGCSSLAERPPGTRELSPLSSLDLAPGEIVAFAGDPLAAPRVAEPVSSEAARAAAAQPRVAIEAVTPSIDQGRFAAKRLVGSHVDIEADLICDGHDKLAASVLWREPGSDTWQDTRMRLLVNDRWTARLPLNRVGILHFIIEAWRDGFASFRDELGKKHAAGVPIVLELQEGRGWLARAAERGAREVAALLPGFDRAAPDEQRLLLLSDATAALMQAADDRPMAARSVAFPLRAERIAAEFSSWYEVFPRSMSDDPARHGTFRDVIRQLPRVRDMGFDVLYFPPIHPIGRINRKGRNNSLTPTPDDPGSPYAIGAAEGGHDAIHPELGTIEDFRALRDAAAAHGLELALDFAIQCSPDHPWLRAHKGWFDWRPDGSIRYAENPPKKYEDIVNVDFYAEDAIPGLWLALADIVLFWAGEGVRLFRVDNPHTKPLPFWEWLFATVQARYPDALFLAEAFTRPKVMYRLGKIGFSQSYTYFTWRNTPAEFREYLTELTTTAPRDFFRPHFFVNTPDINPEFLQTSGRPGFLIRAALAATLSGLWGVYNGFELCEGRPVAPGKEEYLDSEKYQIRAWDWDRPGNITAEITRLNRLRRSNPALQSHLGVSFLAAGNNLVLFYEKATPDRSNVVLVAISFDPYQAQDATLDVPLWHWQLPDQARLDVQDLMTDQRETWQGRPQRVRLTPERPFRIWRAHPTT